jgi:hypothetical protein
MQATKHPLCSADATGRFFFLVLAKRKKSGTDPAVGRPSGARGPPAPPPPPPTCTAGNPMEVSARHWSKYRCTCPCHYFIAYVFIITKLVGGFLIILLRPVSENRHLIRISLLVDRSDLCHLIWPVVGSITLLANKILDIWALLVGVGHLMSWARCRDSHVVGRRFGLGEPKYSPSRFWWSWSVLRFIFSFVVGSALDEVSSESLPGYGVGVNNGGVFRCRGLPWRRFVGMLPAWSLSSKWKSFSDLRRSDDRGINVVSIGPHWPQCRLVKRTHRCDVKWIKNYKLGRNGVLSIISNKVQYDCVKIRTYMKWYDFIEKSSPLLCRRFSRELGYGFDHCCTGAWTHKGSVQIVRKALLQVVTFDIFIKNGWKNNNRLACNFPFIELYFLSFKLNLM